MKFLEKLKSKIYHTSVKDSLIEARYNIEAEVKMVSSDIKRTVTGRNKCKKEKKKK